MVVLDELLPEVPLTLEPEPLDPVVPLVDEPLPPAVLSVLPEVLLDELVSLELDDESSSVDDESGDRKSVV